MTAEFTNISTEGDAYFWDFGDNSGSTDENPLHTYQQDGVYNVMLIAMNSCGNDTTFQEVEISNAPSAGFTADITSGCAPLTVNFTNQSSANTENWNWSFPGGTPSSSTEEDPVVVYNIPGVYSVTLEVSNGAGTDEVTYNGYVIVNDVPNAEFSSSTNISTVTFTNGTINGTSYSWDFGDNNGSTDENPVHTYDMDGVYNVTLIATNDCGTSTFTQEIEIITEPIAGFEGDVLSGCGPLTVNFTDLSSPNTLQWSWTFEGGFPANSIDQNPSVVFNEPGTYTVTLEASNAGGSNTYTQVNYITVLPGPTASFTSTLNGNLANFNNTSTGATSYLWDFGDMNSSTEENPSHVYTEEGSYVVTLIATSDCGSVTYTQEVEVLFAPTANFTADVTEGCAPLTVNFTDQSNSNITSWSWTFEGGTPSTSFEANPTVVFNAPGTYMVTLEVTNATGTDAITEVDYIVVNSTPTADFTSNVNGATVDFINSSVNATSYSWDFGDGIGSSTLPDPSYSYTMAGTFIVTLTAINDCGSVTITEEVTIETPPSVAFVADITEGCAPLMVNFTDQSTGNIISWNWSFPGGSPSSSTEQNPSVIYNTPGIYTVSLEASTAAGTETFTQNGFIVVNTVPDAGFTSSNNGPDYSFTNTSNDATSYSWSFGDGVGTSSEENPNYSYTMDGTYIVTMVATNDCGSTTYEEEVTVLLPPVSNFSSDVTNGCAPLTVNFMDQSSGTIDSWAWTFGGGTPASSTEQNPTVIFDLPGTYTVSLTTGNIAGENTITQTSYIVVTDSAPTSGFDTSINGTTVDFNNTSVGGTQFDWDFGDMNTSMEENPSHTYLEDGTYTVILTVTNDCGTSTIEQTVIIATPPTAGFTFSNPIGCAPLTVEFFNGSSNNVETWAWNFEGGTPATSSEENPVVVFNMPGTYTVTLEVSNAQGTDTETQTSIIIVEDIPTADFTFSVDVFTVDFTNLSNGGSTYSWDFGDMNSSSDENPIHVYTEPGMYEVVLTVTNDCGSNTFTQTVEIEEGFPPVANFSGTPLTGCAPYEVTFFDSSEGAETWAWEFPGGTPASSTEENPIVTYETPGVYDVTLAVTNPFGSNSVTQIDYIIVETVPSAGFTFSTDNSVATFTNTSTNVGSSTYLWDFGDGEFSSMENPTHNYQESGDYTVTLTVTNQCGSSTFEEIVNVMIVNTTDPESLEQFDLFPNPTLDDLTLIIKGLPAEDLTIRLYNVLGQIALEEKHDFHSGNLVRTFELNHLPAATYIVQISWNEETAYRKVIVE